MNSLLVIFLGGGLGSAIRYLLSSFIYRMTGSDFPYGTLVVNVIGCFVIGLFMTAFQDRFLVNPSLRMFLTIGLLGGFTTFSTFSYETIMLLQDAEFFNAGVNITASIGTCLVATYTGMLIGKLI